MLSVWCVPCLRSDFMYAVSMQNPLDPQTRLDNQIVVVPKMFWHAPRQVSCEPPRVLQSMIKKQPCSCLCYLCSGWWINGLRKQANLWHSNIQLICSVLANRELDFVMPSCITEAKPLGPADHYTRLVCVSQKDLMNRLTLLSYIFRNDNC